MLDSADIEITVDEIMYGQEGKPDSVALRLIDRVSTDAAGKRAGDLRTYVHTNFRSTAETHVRRRIDDPHIGRQVRRLKAAIDDCSSAEELLAAFREMYPRQSIGIRQVKRSLTAGATANHRAASLSVLHDETGLVSLQKVS
ncbi:hypothetical protein [Lysinibacter cavernae]|uniref:hypothetical protein n=1 Tax=Lysinibacter cavernae TaxID=1640652 RepID=UPI0036095AEE